MRRVSILAVAAMLAVTLGLRADEKRWWSHVAALANDGMEGRNAGSPGHKRAAEYVASAFQKAGLEPAGIDGYIQPVAFTTRRIVEANSSLALVRNGKAEALTLGEDANISMRVDPVASLDAPLVFVGYGLNIPERNINDFAGMNLKGAVVVHLGATPTSLPGPLQAHFGSAAERWNMYRRSGAVGTISIANPKSMDIPWARSTLARLQPAMSLADASLHDAPGQQLSLTMESRAGRQTARWLRPHVRGTAGACRRRPAGARVSAPRAAEGDDGRRARDGGIAKRRRHIAGLRSPTPGRVRRRLRAPGSPGHWRRRQRRHDLQRRDGQRLRRRRADRGRDDAARERREAGAIDPVRGGDRRGEGPARVALFRRAPHGAPRQHRRQRQHRHVPAAVPAEDADGARSRRVRSRPGHPRHGEGARRGGAG